MANDTAAQLARIRARATGMGFEWFEDYVELESTQFRDFTFFTSNFQFTFRETEESLTTAESLLAVLSPGPVVEIKEPCYKCILAWPGKEIWHCVFSECNPNSSWQDENGKPGPDCPGPAPDDHEWVLVCRRKVVGNE